MKKLVKCIGNETLYNKKMYMIFKASFPYNI